MGTISQDEAAFVEGVSNATGIDPRVLVAWVQQEGAYAQNGTGGHNYLNLRPYSSDVGVSSVTSGNFDQFGNVQDAVASTVARLRQPFAQNIISVAAEHPTPAQEIAAIAGTGWDSGHYGGQGGPNLVATYDQIFKSAQTPYQPPAAAGQILPSVGTGSAADVGSTDITGSGGGPSVAGALGGLNPFSSFEGFFKFVTSWRFAEVVGGFLLLLVGLFLLGRQFGLAVPTPAPLGRQAQSASDTFQFQPGEAEYAARQPTSRARKPRMVSQTLPVDQKPARPERVYDYGEVPY